MELYSDRFVELVGRILVDRLRQRSDVQIIEVKADNRDGLPRQLSEIFESFLESTAP